jgi:monovalent cation/proton antiporter MnhG/PhaG subunit
MKLALDIFTIVAVSAGAFLFLAGTVGLLRFPDALTRLRALTKSDNLGLGLIVLECCRWRRDRPTRSSSSSCVCSRNWPGRR